MRFYSFLLFTSFMKSVSLYFNASVNWFYRSKCEKRSEEKTKCTQNTSLGCAVNGITVNSAILTKLNRELFVIWICIMAFDRTISLVYFFLFNEKDLKMCTQNAIGSNRFHQLLKKRNVLSRRFEKFLCMR